MIDWTAPGTVHTGTSNLTKPSLDWYNQPSEGAADEVVVDNLDSAEEWAADPADCLEPQDCPYPHADPTQPANRPPLSVESSVRNDTKELGLENSLPQTSLRNKPDVIELASLRYFTEDGVRYWTLHTELERLDRHQLVALAEMVRAEKAKCK